MIGALVIIVAALGLYALLGNKNSQSSIGGNSVGISQPIQQQTETAPVEPTPTPTPSAYLLPNSSTEYLTVADISGLTWEELCLARNEIFARHGRAFNTPQIAAYFEAQDWYYATIPAAQFNNNSLSAVEKANVELISQYENSHYGGSYY